jgi:hypothetical protein
MKNDVDAAQSDASGNVHSSISYMVTMAEKPARYLCAPPPGAPELNWQLGAAPVQIQNGRLQSSSLSLEKQGFILRRAVTAVTNFYDDAQVAEIYYPEVERLVGQLTGAQKVLVFDYNRRSGSKEDREKTGAFLPARFAHADYTLRSAPQRVRDLLSAEEARDRLARRYVFINVWRPIKGPVEDETLSVCDAQTVAPTDLVATDLIYAERTGEFYNVTFNPNHRWYYFRHLEASEVLVFTNFDSHDKRVVPHTAFRDPTASPKAPPRESIEVRTIAFF